MRVVSFAAPALVLALFARLLRGRRGDSSSRSSKELPRAVTDSAKSIAALRALESEREDPPPLFVDPFAAALAGEETLARVRARGDGDKGRIAIRTRFFDDAVLAALARLSTAQVVLLGAGLDTRAWRLSPPKRHAQSPSRVRARRPGGARSQNARVRRDRLRLRKPPSDARGTPRRGPRQRRATRMAPRAPRRGPRPVRSHDLDPRGFVVLPVPGRRRSSPSRRGARLRRRVRARGVGGEQSVVGASDPEGRYRRQSDPEGGYRRQSDVGELDGRPGRVVRRRGVDDDDRRATRGDARVVRAVAGGTAEAQGRRGRGRGADAEDVLRGVSVGGGTDEGGTREDGEEREGRRVKRSRGNTHHQGVVSTRLFRNNRVRGSRALDFAARLRHQQPRPAARRIPRHSAPHAGLLQPLFRPPSTSTLKMVRERP